MMDKKINKTDYIPNEKKTNRKIVPKIHEYISEEKTLEAFDEVLKEIAKKSFDDVCEPEKEVPVKEEEDNYRWVFVDNKDLIKSCDHKEEPVKETFLDRMIIEYDQLDNKLEKLDWFMTMAHEFDKLPKKERKLMKKQAETMAKYLYILSKRIDITKEKQKNETNRPSDTGSGN